MGLFAEWWRDRALRKRVRMVTIDQLIDEITRLDSRVRRIEQARNREALGLLKPPLPPNGIST